MTNQLVDFRIEQYASDHSSNADELLLQIEQYTQEHIHSPHMISGHIQGRFLSFLSKLTRPARILEIGTYSGYATLCLAEGLDKNGLIYTIEKNEELNQISQSFFNKSIYAPQIKSFCGEAKTIIPKLDEVWDIVFIDADKKGYELYVDLVKDKLNKNGFIIADNVLFHGEVILETSKQSKTAQAISKFNSKIKHHTQFETLILPFRDGISIIKNKHEN